MQTPTSASSGVKPTLAVKQALISTGAARIPLHIQVQKSLYQRIFEGKYIAGDKLLTDRQIMEEFKVGRMTARAAISSLVEANVVTRRPGCGTFLTDPKEWSRPHQTRTTRFKALLVYQDMTGMHAGPDDSHMLAAIHEGLKSNGLEVNLLSLPGNGEAAYNMLSRYLENQNPDGLVMHAICDERLYELVESFPAVTGNFDIFSHVVAVLADFREILSVALEHLTGLGHTRIGLVTETRHPVHLATSWTFAYQRKMEDLGHPVDRQLICIPRSSSELKSKIKNMLEAENRPTAIIPVGPDAAEYVYRFVESSGLQIPRDLSVFGYGHACEYIPFKPPLTYMTFELEDYGRYHAEALLQQLAGEIPDRAARQVPVSLVTGESTAPPGKT